MERVMRYEANGTYGRGDGGSREPTDAEIEQRARDFVDGSAIIDREVEKRVKAHRDAEYEGSVEQARDAMLERNANAWRGDAAKRAARNTASAGDTPEDRPADEDEVKKAYDEMCARNRDAWRQRGKKV
jgi:hypothetical protein